MMTLEKIVGTEGRIVWGTVQEGNGIQCRAVEETAAAESGDGKTARRL